MIKLKLAFLIATLATPVLGQNYGYQIAVLKYQGGGDWYGNPTSLNNLVLFCNKQLNTTINPEYAVVEAGSVEIFRYPFVHMTGHGNVVFSNNEVDNLRTYMLAGGFLHIDDNYGMDKYVRSEISRLFPETTLQAIPASHPIFHQSFNFNQGLPKIHEHDNKPPEAWGIFIKDKLLLLYTTESDLGDGWEDEEVHNDPVEKRLMALQMGANILEYVFNFNVTH